MIFITLVNSLVSDLSFCEFLDFVKDAMPQYETMKLCDCMQAEAEEFSAYASGKPSINPKDSLTKSSQQVSLPPHLPVDCIKIFYIAMNTQLHRMH